MKGIERIKILGSEVKDKPLLRIINYLVSREDMNEKYLNEEKSLKQMVEFIKNEAKKQAKDGMAWIEDEVVFGWAIHYFDESNKELDDSLKIPSGFSKYIQRQELKNRLIIKTKSEYRCTNCDYSFKSNCKINEMCKCPNCKNKYMIKSNKLKHHEFKEWYCILDRYKDLWIVRRFELITWYDNGKYSFDLCEYGRHIHDKYLNLVHEIFNQNITSCINGKFINHFHDFDKYEWRVNQSYFHSLSEWSILYPGNLKQLLKDTKWKYCQLWTFAKHYDEGVDVIRLLKNLDNRFELLVKQKLYRLALDSTNMLCERLYNKELLYLIKNNIKFLQKYDLDYNELMILKNIKTQNINIIREYGEYVHYDMFLNKVDLKKVYKYTDMNVGNYQEYYDYLGFIEKLKYDLKDKKILYPSNIKEAHDNAEKQVEIVKNKKFNSAISKRYKTLIKNKFNNKKYIIFPAKNVEALVDESSQQNNCVRTYAERVAKGECDIYFMRYLESENKSLVTVEVRNNKVVQKRTKNNFETTKEQDRFLSKWEKEVLSV